MSDIPKSDTKSIQPTIDEDLVSTTGVIRPAVEVTEAIEEVTFASKKDHGIGKGYYKIDLHN